MLLTGSVLVLAVLLGWLRHPLWGPLAAGILSGGGLGLLVAGYRLTQDDSVTAALGALGRISGSGIALGLVASVASAALISRRLEKK